MTEDTRLDRTNRYIEGYCAAIDAYDRESNPYLPHMPFPNPIRAYCWNQGFLKGSAAIYSGEPPPFAPPDPPPAKIFEFQPDTHNPEP